MSAAPESTEASSKSLQTFKNCWGCRLISGGGLILSAAYVFNAARRVMKQGAPTSMGTVAQITFAASLAAWGVVILADPVGKSQRKNPWMKSFTVDIKKETWTWQSTRTLEANAALHVCHRFYIFLVRIITVWELYIHCDYYLLCSHRKRIEQEKMLPEPLVLSSVKVMLVWSSAEQEVNTVYCIKADKNT